MKKHFRTILWSLIWGGLIIMLCNMAQAAAPDWQVDSYPFYTAVLARVKIHGVPLRAEGSKLAAFHDGELRGVAEICGADSEDDVDGEYYFSLMFGANQANEEDFDFKLWNSADDKIYLCDKWLDFDVNYPTKPVIYGGFVGETFTPVIMNAITTYPATITNGTTSPSEPYEGDLVLITANDPPAGMRFDKWVSSDVTLDDATASTTSFIMPAKAVTITATYVVINPTVKYTLSPAGAVTAGAQWKIDDNAWNESGTTVTSTVGTHTITFKAVNGYTTPANQTITLTAGETKIGTGTYVQNPTVKCTLSPIDAVTAGAQWKIDDGAWKDSGATVISTVGSHTISFKDVTGFITPVVQTITLVDGDTEKLTAYYIDSVHPADTNRDMMIKTREYSVWKKPVFDFLCLTENYKYTWDGEALSVVNNTRSSDGSSLTRGEDDAVFSRRVALHLNDDQSVIYATVTYEITCDSPISELSMVDYIPNGWTYSTDYSATAGITGKTSTVQILMESTAATGINHSFSYQIKADFATVVNNENVITTSDSSDESYYQIKNGDFYDIQIPDTTLTLTHPADTNKDMMIKPREYSIWKKPVFDFLCLTEDYRYIWDGETLALVSGTRGNEYVSLTRSGTEAVITRTITVQRSDDNATVYATIKYDLSCAAPISEFNMLDFIPSGWAYSSEYSATSGITGKSSTVQIMLESTSSEGISNSFSYQLKADTATVPSESVIVTSDDSDESYYCIRGGDYQDIVSIAGDNKIVLGADTFTIAIINGIADKAEAANGATVTITANDPEVGMVFDKWTTEDGVIFADSNAANTTFTMLAQNVTITATYKPKTYSIVVNSGSADKLEATAGETVTITANDPEEGFVFDKWTSNDIAITDATGSTSTFTMPAKDVTVTANYIEVPPAPDTKYTLTVVKGKIDGTALSSGQFAAGEEVTITATLPVNQGLKIWTPDKDVEFIGSVLGATTTIRMPAEDVTITASFIAKSSMPAVAVRSTTNTGDDRAKEPASATVAAFDKGKFTFTRTTVNVSKALTVYYSLRGTAENGVDYKTISSSVTFAANATSVAVEIEPLYDTIPEGDETVEVVLEAAPNTQTYRGGSYTDATVSIVDTPPPSPVAVGTVKYTLLPPETVMAGAQWKIDDGDWNNSDAIVTTAVGEHVISFKDVTNYDSPVSQTVMVVEDAETQGTATYVYNPVPVAYTLTVSGGKINQNGVMVSSAQFNAGEIVTITATIPSSTQGLKIWTPSQDVDFIGSMLGATTTIKMPPYDVSITASFIAKSSMPAVSVRSTTNTGDDRAKEPDATTAADKGKFTFTRTTVNQSKALTVYYSIRGTAENGVDYKTIPSSVTFAANSTSVSVEIEPQFDTLLEDDETAEVVLEPAPGTQTYRGGTYTDATVVIKDTPVPLPDVTTVKYTLSPDAVVTAGAQWKIDDGAWNDSGATVTTNVGTHTIYFKDVNGYTTPVSQTITLVAGEEKTGTATYTSIVQNPTVKYTLSPEGAVTVGAQWKIDNGIWNNSGVPVESTVGTHTIYFKDVNGYTTPASQTITLASGDEKTGIATYVALNPTVKYTLSPAAAVTAGAQWRIDGGAWNNSGVTVNSTVGTHTISFKEVDGYNTPASQTITLVVGDTKTGTAAYTPIGGGTPYHPADCKTQDYFISGLEYLEYAGPVKAAALGNYDYAWDGVNVLSFARKSTRGNAVSQTRGTNDIAITRTVSSAMFMAESSVEVTLTFSGTDKMISLFIGEKIPEDWTVVGDVASHVVNGVLRMAWELPDIPESFTYVIQAPVANLAASYVISSNSEDTGCFAEDMMQSINIENTVLMNNYHPADSITKDGKISGLEYLKYTGPVKALALANDEYTWDGADVLSIRKKNATRGGADADDVAITRNVDTTAYTAGSQVTVTLTITGADSMVSLFVGEKIPEGWTVVGNQADHVRNGVLRMTWDAPNIPDSVTYTLKAPVDNLSANYKIASSTADTGCFVNRVQFMDAGETVLTHELVRQPAEWPQNMTLYAPADGRNFREGENLVVTFSWPSVQNAESYRLVVAAYDGTVVFDGTVEGTSCKIHALERGSYIWNVTAIGDDCIAGTTWQDFRFAVVPAVPVPIIIGAVADGTAIRLAFDTTEPGYADGVFTYQALFYSLEAKSLKPLMREIAVANGKAVIDLGMSTTNGYLYIRPVTTPESDFTELYVK